MGYLDRPQRLWWRRAIFQIHLWVGIVLCLYMVVIGLTGSLLVFAHELEHAAYHDVLKSSAGEGACDRPEKTIPAIIKGAKDTHPKSRISVLYLPERVGERYKVFILEGGHTRYLFADPKTGEIRADVDPDRSWLTWLALLHFQLLGGRTGAILNGIGGACLLLLNVSGMIVWWSGLRTWARGLKVDLRKSWKRINFDLHSAVGFWTLTIVSMWAFTGVYFIWPKPIESTVNRVSSVSSALPPKVVVPQRNEDEGASWGGMIERARVTSPAAIFAGAFFPGDRHQPLTLLMARGDLRNFTHMDYVYFDPATGEQLAIWQRGKNRTIGASFIFWLSPLHFGYDWGLVIKILWAAVGCALPILAVTGVFMYWNRSLQKKWRQLMDASHVVLDR
jgi:uncharacterized iron-regulated membrane protein